MRLTTEVVSWRHGSLALGLLNTERLRLIEPIRTTPQDAATSDKEQSMKRFRLTPVTLLSLTLTGVLLPWAGWFSPRHSAVARTTEIRSVKASDLNSEDAQRHRRGQASHWRPMLMQR